MPDQKHNYQIVFLFPSSIKVISRLFKNPCTDHKQTDTTDSPGPLKCYRESGAGSLKVDALLQLIFLTAVNA